MITGTKERRLPCGISSFEEIVYSIGSDVWEAEGFLCPILASAEDCDFIKECCHVGIKLYEKRWAEEPTDYRAATNICILYDRLEDAVQLREHLDQLSEIKCYDYHVWYSLGFLHFKLGEYPQAVRCLERALAIKPYDIDALIRLGYSYEGIRDFDKAIECFNTTLPIVQHERDEENEMEIYHGLGHFYRGKNDRENAVKFMEKARNRSKIYITCYGSIHSEMKDYQRALEILNDALKEKEIRQNKVLAKEITFYKGEALTGLERYVEALEAYKEFEEFCQKRGNKDGVAHAKLYTIKTHLKRQSIIALSITDIEVYLNDLQQHPFSSFANVYIGEEYDKIIDILQGLRLLRAYLADSESVKNEQECLEEIIRKFRVIVADGESLRLPLLSDYPDQVKSMLEEVRPQVRPIVVAHDSSLVSDQEEHSLEAHDVWLACFLRRIPLRHLYLISTSSDIKSIVLWSDAQIDIPEEVTANVIYANTRQDAILILVLTCLFDRIRKHLGQVTAILGLAPLREAPAFSKQTGFLRPVSLSKD